MGIHHAQPTSSRDHGLSLAADTARDFITQRGSEDTLDNDNLSPPQHAVQNEHLQIATSIARRLSSIKLLQTHTAT